MKKLIGLVLVLFLLSVVAPVQAQVTPIEIPLTLTVDVVEALYVNVTPTVVDWTIPLSTSPVGEWIPQLGLPLDYTISYRLAEGRQMQMSVDGAGTLEFDYGDGTLLPYLTYLKWIWTGGIVVSENVIAGNLYSSDDNVGLKEGEIEFEFWNDSTVKAGTATGTVTFMVYSGVL